MLKPFGGIKQYSKIIEFIEDKTTPQYKKFLEYYPKMTDLNMLFKEKFFLNRKIDEINKTLFDEKSLRILFPYMSEESISEYMINKEQINTVEKEKEKVDNSKILESIFKSKEKLIEEEYKKKLNPKAFEILKSNLI